MQGHLGSAHAVADVRKRRLRLQINPPRWSLDDRTVIFQYTGGGGWFYAAFGNGAKYMRAVDNDPALRARIELHAERLRYGRDALGSDLAHIMAAVELSKDYDPEQPRDDDARWTSEGAAGAAAARTVGHAARMFGDEAYAAGLKVLARRALAAAAAALPDLAAAPAAAFFGVLFFPTSTSAQSEGALPGAPDFSYRYDQDTGDLTITHKLPDGTSETVLSAHSGKDLVFRDADGNPIGRYLGGTGVALDADAITGYEARRRSDA